MFFVSGITGGVGGAAARQLLEQGYSVRALVRDPQKVTEWSQRGVEIQQGDFNDPGAVAKALEGVEGAFLMMPPIYPTLPGFSAAKAMIASFQEALRLAPPPRLVLLSSMGSEKDSGLGLITVTHLMEEALADLPFPTAFVRPGSFAENYLGSLEAAASTGWFDSFWAPLAKLFPVIATVDIGHEVARLLVTGWSGKKVVELGSQFSPNDLAQAMSEVLGRPVQARAIPRDQWTTILEARGMPAGTASLYAEMVEGCNSGWIDLGAPGTERGAAPTTPAKVFAEARKTLNQSEVL